jgi:hypothetical protein
MHCACRRARTARVEKRASSNAKRAKMAEDLERREAAFKAKTSEVDSARRHLQVLSTSLSQDPPTVCHPVVVMQFLNSCFFFPWISKTFRGGICLPKKAS